jgi:hypothetical protein
MIKAKNGVQRPILKVVYFVLYIRIGVLLLG